MGFRLGSAEVITRVVSDILKKHNKRHWLVFRFLRRAVRALYLSSPCISGVHLRIAGKIMGRRRKRRRHLRFGRIPFQSLSGDVDFSSRVAATKFGAFGIRAWVFRVRSFGP